MTEAERRLWRHLGRVPVTNTHFRRQAAIGPYVVDFVCHSARLVIEVDGSHHGYDWQAQIDADRTQWLASHGYRALRFWNHEVLTDIEVVLDTVFAALYTPCSTGTAADTLTRSPCPQGGRAK